MSGHAPGRVAPRSVVIVTGLSGAGKASILRVLEDLGYEAVDNVPLPLLEELVSRGERPLAIVADGRTRGFDPATLAAMLARLRAAPDLAVRLVFATADDQVLLRRYTETRRRHPIAPVGRVQDGIAAERALLAPLRDAADWVVETSDLPLSALRHAVEARFGHGAGMTVSLVSFAYPAGLPPEADLVFDARFLRNPHYDPILGIRTGLDPEVAAFVEEDPDFRGFLDRVTDLLDLLLPRFREEGKKYVSVAIGCTGGRHRSVHIVEVLAGRLGEKAANTEPGWRVSVTHRELMRDGARRRDDTGLMRRLSAATIAG